MAVLYSLINEVQDATTSGSTKRQLRALTRITDLFLAGSARYSKRQVELFDEVFKVLVEAIELKTRIKLAHRLAADPDAPAALVRAFAASDAAAVAAPGAQPVDSAQRARPDRERQHPEPGPSSLAIARRETISEVITDILIERGEQHVVHAVAQNAGAEISDDGFRELVLRGRRRRPARAACRHEARHSAPSFPEASGDRLGLGMQPSWPRNPQLADVVQDAVTEVIDDINGRCAGTRRLMPRRSSGSSGSANWKELGEGDVHAAARRRISKRR